MSTLTLKAPAKLNLFLKVGNIRRDGYHNIQTIFEKINLCDRLELNRRRAGISLTSNKQDLPRNEKNLAYRAAKELINRSKRKFGLNIRIKKNIPVAAGLGGGSSDAAAVLLGLNRLYRLGLKRQTLFELAKKIGADVPFFVSQYKRALGSGRGDKLRPLPVKQKYYYLLINPGFGVSTAVIYRNHKIFCARGNNHLQSLIKALDKGRIPEIEDGLYNDLQASVLKKHRRLQKIIAGLKNLGIKNPIITGSGPVIFTLAKTKKEAKILKEKLLARLPDLDIKIVKSYNR